MATPTVEPNETTTSQPWRRSAEPDASTVPDAAVAGEGLKRTGLDWLNGLQLVLGVSLLGLSVFASPPHPLNVLLVFLAIGTSAIYLVSVRAVTRSSRRRVALLLVILLDLDVIASSAGGHVVLYGWTLREWGTILALASAAVWTIRRLRLRSFGLERGPVDVAVLMMWVVTSSSFAAVQIGTRPGSASVSLDLFWIVSVATLLHFVLADVLCTAPAIKRTVLILLMPTLAACLGTLALWLALVGLSVLIVSSSGWTKAPRHVGTAGRV